MFTVTQYPHGTFCWADCSSTDQTKAKAFYEAVMGWASHDMPIGNDQIYTMFKQDGQDVAAVGPAQEGMPMSVWNSYIAVDDVDALMDRVTELGGTVVAGPFDIFDSGRMAAIQDPLGAFVNLWQANKHIGSGLVNIAGAMTWNELTTHDLAKSEAFFSALLGWTFEDGPYPGYRLFYVNGRANGGMMQMDDQVDNMTPGWMVCFSVADIDDITARINEHGGKPLHEIMGAEGIGRFVAVTDPGGAQLTLMQVLQPDTWPQTTP